MHFCFFGYDFSLNLLQALEEDGHEVEAIFSFPCDNVFNFNRELTDYAQKHNIPIRFDAPSMDDLKKLEEEGCEVFLCAGYPYKIPVPEGRDDWYGINLHPSHLPKGRGIMPTPHILLDYPEAAGLTLHKLTPHFDCGDILAQEAIDITLYETVETYSTKVAMRAPELVSRVMADFETHWENAYPQDEKEAIHFKKPDDEMRFLDWEEGVERIDKVTRAFGRFGALAEVGGTLYVVYHIDSWKQQHGFLPGRIVRHTPREFLMAASDGFVLLKDFQPFVN